MFSTSIALVRVLLCTCAVCMRGPPDCKCMVNLRDRVVVVKPMYELLRCSQSSSLHLYSYIRLVFCRVAGLFLQISVSIVYLL